MPARKSDKNRFERGLLLGLELARGASLTTKDLRDRFGLSPATAKRDMLLIEVTARAARSIGPNRRVTLRMASVGAA